MFLTKEDWIKVLVEDPDSVGVYRDWMEENRIEKKAINKVSDLVGEVLIKIEQVGVSDLIFWLMDGRKFKFHHEQDCCESVYIEDVDGDWSLLLGSPLLVAEERVSYNELVESEYTPDSQTWTFYTFATILGHVSVRWYGQSNGYYSESVDFEEVK